MKEPGRDKAHTNRFKRMRRVAEAVTVNLPKIQHVHVKVNGRRGESTQRRLYPECTRAAYKRLKRAKL